MKKQNRATLRRLFRDGALPSGEDYALLIESMVNRADDGFDKPDADGLRLTSGGTEPALVSFYRGAGSRVATWSIRHGKSQGAIDFKRGDLAGADRPLDDDDMPLETTDEAAALTLSGENNVGVGLEEPEWPLDVNGVVRMDGRIGRPTEGLETVPADGKWHPIATGLTGCNMLEVVAGVGGVKHRGRYALLHAIATNAYNPGNRLLNFVFGRRKIKTQNAVFGSFTDRVRLRWRGSDYYNYSLEIKTNAKYGKDIKVRYYITRLWFDQDMAGSRPAATSEDAAAETSGEGAAGEKAR